MQQQLGLLVGGHVDEVAPCDVRHQCVTNSPDLQRNPRSPSADSARGVASRIPNSIIRSTARLTSSKQISNRHTVSLPYGLRDGHVCVGEEVVLPPLVRQRTEGD